MPEPKKCEVLNCENDRLYVVKIKKSDDDDTVHRVCKNHRDQYEQDCKENSWEFMEING